MSVRCHTSDEAENNREDINKLWVQYQAIIITSTITDGIDFNREHFDCMFVFTNNRCGPVRNIKQMMGRVRKLRTGFIFLHIRMADYHYPISYNTIKSGIINRKLSYLDTSEKIEATRVSATEMCICLNDSRGCIGSDGTLCLDYGEDHWFTILHVLNVQEHHKNLNFII